MKTWCVSASRLCGAKKQPKNNYVKSSDALNVNYLRNGKRVACNCRVMDACGRLLSTKDAQESHKAIASCDSSFLGAKQTSQLPNASVTR